MMRIGNLAIDSKYTENIYLSTIYLDDCTASLSVVLDYSVEKRDANRDLEQEPSQPFPLYIYRTLEHNSLGEISSATIKEQVDRVIFHRQSPTPLSPWIGHVDSIMQKYDNSPTPHRPGQINALSGPDPNAGSPLQLEDHNIFLRLLE